MFFAVGPPVFVGIAVGAVVDVAGPIVVGVEPMLGFPAGGKAIQIEIGNACKNEQSFYRVGGGVGEKVQSVWVAGALPNPTSSIPAEPQWL